MKSPEVLRGFFVVGNVLQAYVDVHARADIVAAIVSVPGIAIVTYGCTVPDGTVAVRPPVMAAVVTGVAPVGRRRRRRRAVVAGRCGRPHVNRRMALAGSDMGSAGFPVCGTGHGRHASPDWRGCAVLRGHAYPVTGRCVHPVGRIHMYPLAVERPRRRSARCGKCRSAYGEQGCRNSESFFHGGLLVLQAVKMGIIKPANTIFEISCSIRSFRGLAHILVIILTDNCDIIMAKISSCIFAGSLYNLEKHRI